MKYNISKKISWQVINDLLWIIDEESQDLYAIRNEASVLIWQSLYNGIDEKEIKENLYDIYKLEQVKEDSHIFIQELLEKGLIEYGRSL